MLYAPPGDEPPLPVPRIQRTVNRDGVGGLTLPDFASSDQLLAQMPPQLQVLFANRKIERPKDHTNGGPTLGTYYPNGRVVVDRSTDDPKVARHELLHGYSVEAPQYRAEPYFHFGRMTQAIRNSDQSVIAPAIRPNDPAHTFVFLAELALDNPDLLPPALQDYFAPLIKPKGFAAPDIT